MNDSSKKAGNSDEDWKIYEILCTGSLDIKNDMETDLDTDIITTLRSEIAGLQYKKEKLLTETNDLKSQMLSRDQRVLEQQVEIDLLREQSARQNAIVTSLKRKILDLEESQRNLYAAQGRQDNAYQTLQRDCRYFEDKCKEYENKIQILEVECHNEEKQKESLRCQLQDFIRKLSVTLGLDYCESTHLHSPDSLLIKASELVQEVHILKTKCQKVSESATCLDQELRNCKDLLERANSEKDVMQRQISTQVIEIERLKQDKDSLNIHNRMVERDLNEAREKLCHCSKNLSVVTDSVTHNEHIIMKLKDDLKHQEDKCQRLYNENKNTIDSIAMLLSLPSKFVEANETSVKERIREILDDNKEKSTQIQIYKDKLSSESQKLHRSTSQFENTSMRIRVLEDERNILEAKVHKLESEINNLEMSRDSLRKDKADFVSFLERLSRTLNMDEITQEIGIELHTDSILHRAEQLARLESDKHVDKLLHYGYFGTLPRLRRERSFHDLPLFKETAVVYQLQRRIRNLREQIQRKDLHLDLLKKKLNLQEDSSKIKSILQAEKDEGLMKMKRLNKQIDKLTLQLSEARAQIREQNTQLADAADYKIAALERARKIEELQKRLEETEMLRSRYNRKVNLLKDQVRNTGETVEQERNIAEHQISLLKDELTRTKESLAEASRREAQLNSFRNSIAKLLGILIPSSVSDLEMISRLQKLIDAHHDFTIVSRRYDDPTLLRATSRSPTGPPSRCRTRTPERSRYDDSGYTDPGYDIDDDLYKRRAVI